MLGATIRAGLDRDEDLYTHQRRTVMKESEWQGPRRGHLVVKEIEF